MEYGLWLIDHLDEECGTPVLILVLMEYGLWLTIASEAGIQLYVLILVLMEYGLWLSKDGIMAQANEMS